jgi:hypothetical protein
MNASFQGAVERPCLPAVVSEFMRTRIGRGNFRLALSSQVACIRASTGEMLFANGQQASFPKEERQFLAP